VPSPSEHRARERGRQLDRVNAFSDGVFSIAATLLVLSIDIPNGTNANLTRDLANLERPVFAYFVSFAVVSVFWLHHHRLLGRLAASDQGFAVRNLVFLSFVALLPAPTQLLARYPDKTAPVIIYAINVMVLAALSMHLSRYADASGLTDAPAEDLGESWVVRYSVFLAFGISIPIAFLDPRDATWVWLLSAVIPRVAGRLDGSHEERKRRKAQARAHRD
jgi:uncharacterized membrane protein